MANPTPSAETAPSDSPELEARFREAIELLDGGHSADEGPRALAAIRDIAGQGHADALAMQALFSAMGAGQPQSWAQALDLLRRAAELGSDMAQAQLGVLASRGAHLSAEALLDPPPRTILADSPRVVAFPGFATAAECDWVMARAKDRLKPAMVFDDATGKQVENPVRNNSGVEFQLHQMDVVLELLRARISACTRLPVPIFEPMQVLRYRVGQQFKPHHDYLDPAAPGFAEILDRYGQRIATVLVFLNDDFSGGETLFPKLGIRHRGHRGDALFFTNVDRTGRGDPLSMHAGAPPTSGEKWIISQWIRDRAPGSPFAGGATHG